MSFSSSWLALREPHDHAARSVVLAERLAAWVRGHHARHVPAGPLQLVELAGGTGSGIRWLGPRLPHPQQWQLVDHDPSLLRAVPPDLATPIQHDLRELGTLSLEAHAVSLQALLDLVGLGDLVALADWVSARHAPILAALTVDGRVAWEPADLDDARVQAAFRLHQLGDRGFGASVGIHAAPIFADLLRVRGYTVELAEADWVIGPEHPSMLRAMVDGTAAASDPAVAPAWAERRRAQIAQGQLALRVGHLDLLALP